MLAAKTAVMAPNQAITCNEPLSGGPQEGWACIKGYIRATKKTPAATIVAAWIKALTGVGPSMASGNQTCKGTWPDLPTAPQKIKSPIPVETVRPSVVPFA